MPFQMKGTLGQADGGGRDCTSWTRWRDSKCWAGYAELGPRWVRVAMVACGRQWSPTVTRGREESQLVERLAHAAGMMRAGDSDCGHEGPGWLRRAADGQQPVFVTTGEPASKPWRIMTADSAIDGH
jgi:hypothetical protein